VSVLGRKLVRDLRRLKGQVATIALVLACGIMAMIMLRSTWSSLLEARDSYYERHRFADVFARLERAPAAVASRLEHLPGVAVVETRIVEDVMVPLATERDPVQGRIVSLPNVGRPLLNDLHLSAGRLPHADDEAVVLEQFAQAHELELGDRLPVVLNGRLRSIEIVGIALSPEYVLAMSGAELAPDNRRFVVLWMRRDAIAPAFQLEGAFNDVVLRIQHGASLAAVLEAVDRELAPYGGLHAVARDKQMSNYALANELAVLRTLALVVPAIFLAVAAFLVNFVVSRLVFLERTQIAVLKALGFTNGQIALHYLALVALIVAIAAVLGTSAGFQTGKWMTDLYADFYRFPTRVHHVAPALAIETIGIGLAAGVVGALSAVRRIARMAPAQAMRPPAPLGYRHTLTDRLGLGNVLGPSAMMVVREIRRKPFRFVMSVLGIAMGVAIFVMGRFSWDSFDYLMSEIYPRGHHQDLTVTVSRAVPERAVHELDALPGVDYAEGERDVPVRMRAGPRQRDARIVGMPAAPALRELQDRRGNPVALPPAGLVMTDKLAEVLGLRVGDLVDVDVLEGDFAKRRLPVVGLVDEPFGLQAYARADWLAGVLREQPRVSVIYLRVDPAWQDAVRARLKQTPAVLGVASTENVIERVRRQTGESMLTMAVILTLSAAAIAIGVVYNNARIALSLRSRDLATLRVLGFTRVEISIILLGELGAQVLAGIPLGLWLGTSWSHWLASSIDSETIRFPVHISARTYVEAAVIALVSGIVSALLVRRRLDQLDLVAVLKSSE
jgi:putative ABC transport system permease protein